MFSTTASAASVSHSDAASPVAIAAFPRCDEIAPVPRCNPSEEDQKKVVASPASSDPQNPPLTPQDRRFLQVLGESTGALCHAESLLETPADLIHAQRLAEHIRRIDPRIKTVTALLEQFRNLRRPHPEVCIAINAAVTLLQRVQSRRAEYHVPADLESSAPLEVVEAELPSIPEPEVPEHVLILREEFVGMIQTIRTTLTDLEKLVASPQGEFVSHLRRIVVLLRQARGLLSVQLNQVASLQQLATCLRAQVARLEEFGDQLADSCHTQLLVQIRTQCKRLTAAIQTGACTDSRLAQVCQDLSEDVHGSFFLILRDICTPNTTEMRIVLSELMQHFADLLAQ